MSTASFKNLDTETQRIIMIQKVLSACLTKFPKDLPTPKELHSFLRTISVEDVDKANKNGCAIPTSTARKGASLFKAALDGELPNDTTPITKHSEYETVKKTITEALTLRNSQEFRDLLKSTRGMHSTDNMPTSSDNEKPRHQP